MDCFEKVFGGRRWFGPPRPRAVGQIRSAAEGVETSSWAGDQGFLVGFGKSQVKKE
jgi:hypothetical protein